MGRIGEGKGKGRGNRGGGREDESRGGEERIGDERRTEGLPPIKWRSGYAPAYAYCIITSSIIILSNTYLLVIV